jgi:hypothetical protein
MDILPAFVEAILRKKRMLFWMVLGEEGLRAMYLLMASTARGQTTTHMFLSLFLHVEFLLRSK